MVVSILYGVFAGGMPGNGPLVYKESFQVLDCVCPWIDFSDLPIYFVGKGREY